MRGSEALAVLSNVSFDDSTDGCQCGLDMVPMPTKRFGVLRHTCDICSLNIPAETLGTYALLNKANIEYTDIC